MGANEFCDFYRMKKDESLAACFHEAVERTAWECGHGGYTGTLAEKGSFVLMGNAPDRKIACEMANKFLNDDDPRISDKWGPAGAITTDDGYAVFFGWASS